MENVVVFTSFKSSNEKNENHFIYDSKKITNLKTNEYFNFDYIINPTMLNIDIFKKLIKNNLTYLLKGINVSIITYGETGTGKTAILKGEEKSTEGLIELSIKEIFNLLNNKNSLITKYNIKISYFEIFNETINDLIDNSKKNLEIKESIYKGAFVHNISEVTVTNMEKFIQLLNKGESNRIISDSKIREKSTKSHNIFKINIEYFLKDTNQKNKIKKYNTQLNLIEIAGSENLSNLDSEPNINKSLSSFNHIINKLSKNNKSLVNYKSSKLTRLLQMPIEGNSKSIIICTIIDDSSHYEETLNTLKFGIKAKNLKTNIKVNKNINNKKKETKENQALKNKIKTLEKIINEKKLTKQSNNDINEKQNNEQIANLEKEVLLLKKYLMNNEDIGSDINSFQEEIWLNQQEGNIINNDFLNMNRINNINTSAYKNSFKQRLAFSAMRGPGSAIKNTYLNSPFLHNKYQSDVNNISNLNILEGNKHNFNKNICMTEMRPGAYVPKFFFHSSLGKTVPPNNNFLENSNIEISMPDLNNNINTIENDYLIKENEELKSNIYELKKTYYEVVRNKEQQITLLNQNHNITMENCEKLIKEAESNYINLKNKYEQALEEMKLKENELNELKQKNINQDSSINFYKKELNKVGDFNYANEIEIKYNNLLEENLKLKEIGDIKNIKLKEENELLKKNIDMIENKYKEKCEDINENQKIINEKKKQYEKEIHKYKIEIKNLKELSKKNNNNNNNLEKNKLNNDIVKEYENKINKLIEENNNYKNNLEKIEKVQIVEYQKLLDDSFAKISQLNEKINVIKNKNEYLEKEFNNFEYNLNNKVKISDENKKIENIIDINESNSNNGVNQNIKLMQSIKRQNKNDREYFSSNRRNVKGDISNNRNNQKFLSKKRGTIQKIYQNTIDKEQINNENQTSNKENNNFLNTEFSNFKI